MSILEKIKDHLLREDGAEVIKITVTEEEFEEFSKCSIDAIKSLPNFTQTIILERV